MSTPFRSSNIYFVITLIVFVAAAVYSAFQFQTLRAYKQAIADNEIRYGELTLKLDNERTEFQPFAEKRAQAQAEFGKKIVTILPSDENYTDLTRQLDNYFAEHDTPGNPIFQSSLRFGKGGPVEPMPGVSSLPVNMNIEATRDNFFKLLEFVNNSGSLETGTRLMEINSIQLNFPEGGEVVKDLKQKINFTVDMNAYYQTPKISR